MSDLVYDEAYLTRRPALRIGEDVYMHLCTPRCHHKVIICTHPDHHATRRPRLYLLGQQRLDHDAREVFPLSLMGFARLLTSSTIDHARFTFYKRIAAPLKMFSKTRYQPYNHIRLRVLTFPGLGINPWAPQDDDHHD